MDLENNVETTIEEKSKEKGASMVEYALLVALIALIAIAAITVLGQQTSRVMSANSGELRTAAGASGH